MSQKKEGPESTENKPGVKIQDLSPKKDAKGGGGRFNPNSGASADGGTRSADGGTRSADGGTKGLD